MKRETAARCQSKHLHQEQTVLASFWRYQSRFIENEQTLRFVSAWGHRRAKSSEFSIWYVSGTPTKLTPEF